MYYTQVYPCSQIPTDIIKTIENDYLLAQKDLSIHQSFPELYEEQLLYNNSKIENSNTNTS